jgi:cellulose synthase/poly-beta-1,6-N-acetylglucosamine synthase-like glycosyltransferase
LKPQQFSKGIIYTEPAEPTLKPLTIATPFYYSFHFIQEYLESLFKLDYPKKLITLAWAVQGNDETYDILNDIANQWRPLYKQIILVKRSETVDGANTRNQGALNVCDQRNYLKSLTDDDVLFIGHDNFAPSNAVKRLLQCQSVGGDISGGVYPFAQNMGLGFTSFFMLNQTKNGKKQYCTAILKHNGKLWFPQCLLNQRVRLWTVGMDCTLIKREVLNKIDFGVDLAPEIVTDDVQYCFKAHELGYTVVSDYGLWVKHWGFDLQFLCDKSWRGWIQVCCLVQPWLIDLRNSIKRMREATISI